MRFFSVKRMFLFFLLFLFLLLQTFVHSRTIKDFTNTSITIPEYYSPTIISLSPYVTEILFELDYADKIIGVTDYCNRPESAKNKESIGSILNPNIEKILKLNPDIVIATKEDQTIQLINKLRSLNVNVVVLGESKSFADIEANYLLVADVIGRLELAKKQLENILKELYIIRRKISRCARDDNGNDRDDNKVFIIIEVDPLITVSKSSYLNDILGYVGLSNVVKIEKPRYPLYSREKLLLDLPDFILNISCNEILHCVQDDALIVPYDKFFDRFLDVPIISADPDIFSRPNPYAFLEAVKVLEEKIENI